MSGQEKSKRNERPAEKNEGTKRKKKEEEEEEEEEERMKKQSNSKVNFLIG